MSNKSKGTAHEKAVSDHLTAQGYLVERGFKKVAFVRGRPMAVTKDLFGAFDLVAVSDPRGLIQHVRFIQVTAGGGVAARRSKALAVWHEAEVWEWIKCGIYRVHRTSSIEVVDISPRTPTQPKMQECAPHINESNQDGRRA